MLKALKIHCFFSGRFRSSMVENFKFRINLKSGIVIVSVGSSKSVAYKDNQVICIHAYKSSTTASPGPEQPFARLRTS